MSNVVIFGKGKVGMATNLTLKLNADFHDPFKETIVTDFSTYKYAIICVSSLLKGPHDHHDIDESLNLLQDVEFNGVVVIRCTVSPVHLRVWEIAYPQLKIIHFPEFLKQGDGNYLDTPWAVVLGGQLKYTEPFGQWLLECGYGNKDIYQYVTLDESALIKLHQNAGLALKVTFANLMYETCQYYGADYERVRKGVGADVRVGNAHMDVPGEDGFGFGGHCLPKDLVCLNHVTYTRGLWDAIININKMMRAKNV